LTENTGRENEDQIARRENAGYAISSLRRALLVGLIV